MTAYAQTIPDTLGATDTGAPYSVDSSYISSVSVGIVDNPIQLLTGGTNSAPVVPDTVGVTDTSAPHQTTYGYLDSEPVGLIDFMIPLWSTTAQTITLTDPIAAEDGKSPQSMNLGISIDESISALDPFAPPRMPAHFYVVGVGGVLSEPHTINVFGTDGLLH